MNEYRLFKISLLLQVTLLHYYFCTQITVDEFQGFNSMTWLPLWYIHVIIFTVETIGGM